LRLKILKKLRSASLNSDFIGFCEKNGSIINGIFTVLGKIASTIVKN